MVSPSVLFALLMTLVAFGCLSAKGYPLVPDGPATRRLNLRLIGKLEETSASSTPSEPPSEAPTLSLTADPTTMPTFSPTADPSSVPSYQFTAAPTFDLTVAPTMMLTTVPTLVPTVAPTIVSSEVPSLVPTAPIDSTSLSPTLFPTIEPTPSPTSFSSVAPTSEAAVPQPPNEEPTAAPTYFAVPPTQEPDHPDIYYTAFVKYIYTSISVILVAGTFWFCCRNCFDRVSTSQYSMVSTNDMSELFPRSSRNSAQLARDIELARFQRMAGGTNTYPNPFNQQQ